MKVSKYYHLICLAAMPLLLGALTVQEWQKQITQRITALESRVTKLEKSSANVKTISLAAIPWKKWDVPVEHRIDNRVQVKFFRSADERFPYYIHWTMMPIVPVEHYMVYLYFYKGNERLFQSSTTLDNVEAGEVIKGYYKSVGASSQVTRIVLQDSRPLE